MLQIESGHNIVLSDFWNMWRQNPYAFWGSSVTSTVLAFTLSLHAMATIPTPIFCTSPDPCDCSGGGFDIYTSFCTASAMSKNTSANVTAAMRKAMENNVTAARDEFSSLFIFLDDTGSTSTILVSAAVIVVIGLTSVIVRMNLTLSKELEARSDLEKQNKENQEQLMLDVLNEAQTEMVEENAADLDNVPTIFHLHWRMLKFLERLGSGSFGDCCQYLCE